MCDHSFLGFLSTGFVPRPSRLPRIAVTPRASERLKIESESEGRQTLELSVDDNFFGHDHFSGGSHAR